MHINDLVEHEWERGKSPTECKDIDTRHREGKVKEITPEESEQR